MIFALFLSNRARRRKKVAKAIERQARKLRAKGITVDLEALKAEYLSQHRGQTINSSESEDNEEEDPIDVVGGADDSDDDTEDCSTHTTTRRDSTDHLINYSSSSDDTSKHTIRSNPFSIESLLYRNT
jgi:homeobox protein Unc-4